MPRVRHESAVDRELREIEQLSRRVVDEAPEPGANPLDTDAAEINVTKSSKFVQARKFVDLTISQRTVAGLTKGKWQRMTDIPGSLTRHTANGIGGTTMNSQVCESTVRI